MLMQMLQMTTSKSQTCLSPDERITDKCFDIILCKLQIMHTRLFRQVCLLWVSKRVCEWLCVCVCVCVGARARVHVHLYFYIDVWETSIHIVVALHLIINPLVPELFFLISAHTVYKMWIIQEPNKLALWNKLHFEENKTESIEHV